MKKTYYDKATRFVIVFLVAALFASASIMAQPSPRSDDAKSGETIKAIDNVVNTAAQIETISLFVKQYINKEKQIKGSEFLLFDPVYQEAVQLELINISGEEIFRVSDNLSVVPATFDAKSGNSYGLDFLLTDEEGSWVVSEIAIREENGVLRYSWREENGTWIRDHLDVSSKSTE